MIQGRIHVWSESAPAPPFDRQIMQIQPILGYFWAIFWFYQPPGPPLFTYPGSAPVIQPLKMVKFTTEV